MNQEDLELGVSKHSGLPNPANDNTLSNLDINKLLIKHPLSTFFMQIEGNEWTKYGIFKGDIALVDRSLIPQPKDLAVFWAESSFGVAKVCRLPIDTTIWGIIPAIIHRYRP